MSRWVSVSGVRGYVRVAPGEGPELGLEAQRAALLRAGVPPGDVVADENVNALQPLASRPEGGDLWRRVEEAGEGGATLRVVVVRLDRLVASLGELRDLLVAGGGRVEVRAVEEGLVLDAGEASHALVEAAAHVEATAATSTASLRRCRGNVPYGRRRTPNGFLVPDHDELVTLDRLRQLAAEGMSLRRIAAALRDEGRPTRAGRPWGVQTLRQTLQRLSGDMELVYEARAAAHPRTSA